MRTVNTDRLNQFWNEGILQKVKELTERITRVSEKIDVLDTKEEIEANTDDEKMAGALAVKEMFGQLDSNLNNFTDAVTNNEYCLSNGKTGYTKVGNNVTFTGCLYIQGTPTAYSTPLVTNLPIPISTGFIAHGRSNQTGDLKLFWINGKNIMPAEPLSSGHIYSLSFSYIAV